ncbi:cytochrome c-type biogenesis protein CcmH [Deinococcus lacus]|uniref:Cytochrome c-type biogenesis protein n=1 Tax=Deinococcus lacus TaxID=392561 RepID=A0ABW1YA19_9DEIO
MKAALLAALLSSLGTAPLPALSPQQAAEARAISANLRCPICKGENILDSSNDISAQMRREVQEQVAAGQSDQDIYNYFSARYGNYVLLDPPKQGRTLALWLLPLAALGAGGWQLSRALRGSGEATTAVSDEPHDPFLEQVQRETRRERS